MMDCSQATILAIDTGNDKELMTLAHCGRSEGLNKVESCHTCRRKGENVYVLQMGLQMHPGPYKAC